MTIKKLLVREHLSIYNYEMVDGIMAIALLVGKKLTQVKKRFLVHNYNFIES